MLMKFAAGRSNVELLLGINLKAIPKVLLRNHVMKKRVCSGAEQGNNERQAK
jgi:hypothetical protein